MSRFPSREHSFDRIRREDLSSGSYVTLIWKRIRVNPRARCELLKCKSCFWFSFGQLSRLK